MQYKTQLLSALALAIGLSMNVQAHEYKGKDHASRHDRGAGLSHQQYDRGSSRVTRIDRRQERQHDRIRHGIRNGQLTRGETRELFRQQKKIAKMQRRFESDGHISSGEYRRLERALDRASRDIRQAKHNDRERRYSSYRDHHASASLNLIWAFLDQ